MAANNGGAATLAKSGDIITLTITASEAVTDLVCTIDGEATTMCGSGTSWTSALTLSGDETEGNTAFSCASHKDATGNIGATDTTATSGAVTIDLTAPTISGATPSWGTHLDMTEDNSGGTVAVTTTGAADGATVTVTVGGVSTTCTVADNACTATVVQGTLAGLSEATHTITVAMTADAAGNAVTSNTATTFIYDKTVPTLTIAMASNLSLIHIRRCRRLLKCCSRWPPPHSQETEICKCHVQLRRRQGGSS